MKDIRNQIVKVYFCWGNWCWQRKCVGYVPRRIVESQAFASNLYKVITRNSTRQWWGATEKIELNSPYAYFFIKPEARKHFGDNLTTLVANAQAYAEKAQRYSEVNK